MKRHLSLSDARKFFYAVASKHLITRVTLNDTFSIIVTNKNFLKACERTAFCTWLGAVKGDK